MGKSNGSVRSVGSIRSLINEKGDFNGGREKAVETIKEFAPLVAECLAGCPKDSQGEEMPPGSITFWLDGPVAKFTYSVKTISVTYYGTVADLAKPWESVNSALLMGEVSRKRHSVNENTLAELDKAGKVY